jgi:hypothetical protein
MGSATARDRTAARVPNGTVKRIKKGKLRLLKGVLRVTACDPGATEKSESPQPVEVSG